MGLRKGESHKAHCARGNVAVRRYAAFASLRVVAYFALALLLVFGNTPFALADGEGEGQNPGQEQQQDPGHQQDPDQPDQPDQPDPPAPQPADFGALNAEIGAAQELAGQYPAIDSEPAEVELGKDYVTSATQLQDAIGVAQGVAGDAGASQDVVDNATAALQAAEGAFRGSVQTGTKQPPPPADAKIADVEIYLENTNDCLASSAEDYTATHPDMAEKARIDQKGGTLKFDYVVTWDNGQSNRNGLSYITWTLSPDSDPAVATINNAGELTAHKDGTVKVRAVVPADRATGGGELFAQATIAIAGQDDKVYVESIRILGPDGADVTGAVYEVREKLATAQVKFAAAVTVVDPATDERRTYNTADGPLSAQAPELGDLTWRVGDTAMAAVDETTGLYRPARYGMVALMVESKAGFGGASVSASTIVSTINPDEGEQGDEYHPQDTLTIKAYYTGPDATGRYHTPEEDGDAAYVINKEYSLGDLQALGALTAYYTAFANGGDFYTMQGTGVPFSSVLRDAGVNMDGIDSFAFITADWPTGENRPVTYGFVFGDRYFYPNIDIGSYADAVQVFPILAWESSQMKNSTEISQVPMTEATRYRLLFGATPDGGNSQYQIKWINTIFVRLSGYEAPGGGDEPGGGGENGGGSSADNPSNGEGESGAGDAADTAGAAGSSSAQAADAKQEGASASSASAQAADAEKRAVGGPTQSETTGGRARNVYQVMNKHESEVEKNMDANNPYAPFTAPLGMLVTGAGGLESLLWFRFQQRGASVAAKGM